MKVKEKTFPSLISLQNKTSFTARSMRGEEFSFIERSVTSRNIKTRIANSQQADTYQNLYSEFTIGKHISKLV